MSINLTNWTNDNRKVIAQMGSISVIEHQKDLSVDKATATVEYFSHQMNVKRRQVEIALDGKNSCKVQAGAMQMMIGNVEMAAGIKGGAKGLLNSVINAAVTNETIVKPEYTGTGKVILEPTYKHIILQDVSQWGKGGLVIEDGMFLASEGTVQHQVVDIADDLSTVLLSSEGLCNLCFTGSGIVALESYVPLEELIEIELEDDVIKIDGNLAVCWSGTLKFKIEKSAKSFVGSFASGEGILHVFRGTGKIWVSPVAGTYASDPSLMRGGEAQSKSTSKQSGLIESLLK